MQYFLFFNSASKVKKNKNYSLLYNWIIMLPTKLSTKPNSLDQRQKETLRFNKECVWKAMMCMSVELLTKHPIFELEERC